MSEKEITISEYNKKCDKIIKKGKDIDETLFELLRIASKYKLKGGKRCTKSQ